MASNNSINNTISNNNFTVPNGNITALGNITATSGIISATANAINAGTTMTAGTGITSTTGNIIATAGQVNAGTTMTAGTGITATTGNITASAGDVIITAGNLTLPDTNAGGTQGLIKFGAFTTISDFPTGSSNFFAGSLVANTTMTGTANNGIGGGVFSMVTSGGENSGFGHTALQTIKTGNRNSAYGEGALNGMDSGNNNVAVGYEAAWVVSTGSNNTALGQLAGSAWTGANSNNIAINNIGVSGDSGKIRIGTNATHTATFITGIDGVNIGSVAKVLTMASDQLGTATITAGTGITVTPGANTITIASSGTSTLTYTTVNTTPYVVLTTDEFLGVDSSGSTIQINLPNAPSTGRTFTIKDTTGSANSNAITVTTVGGAVLIDAAATYVMNTQYAAIDVLFNGTKYLIY